MRKSVIHLNGDKFDKHGASTRVTLCITRKREAKKNVSVGHISTTNNVNAVTCPRCLKIIEEKNITNKTSSTHTDCRSEVGITVGIIDSIITSARLLKNRDLTSIEVNEALLDLKADEDLRSILLNEKHSDHYPKKQVQDMG